MVEFLIVIDNVLGNRFDVVLDLLLISVVNLLADGLLKLSIVIDNILSN